MKNIATLLFSLVLAGCAATAPVLSRDNFLRDDLFTPAQAVADPGAVFKISDEMKRYLQNDIAPQLRDKGPVRGLYEALYNKRQLQLDYDAAETRTAAEAFAARSGNCLSLVIMTAALAKELGMFVHFQGVESEENWQLKDDLFFSGGHVNLTLGRKRSSVRFGYDTGNLLTIDFTPLAADVTQRAWHLDETTIIAMYMNNRAAETLGQGRVREAYWWVREAIRQDGRFLAAYNTLAVIYRRSGHPELAEPVLRYILNRDADNVHALSNLTLVLKETGRVTELAEAAQRLKWLMPYEPYHFFKLGRAAMLEKNYRVAREMFAREVNRQPYHAEFHYWLASAHIALSEKEKALRHLAIALDTSHTLQERGIYAAKLDKIRAANIH
jgi:tetratricopeptide (TPR) repeat protein